MDLLVQNIPLSEIHPYPKNNRIHSPIQIDLIAKSISEFTATQPIVVDEKNTILVGHGRLLAAQKLGLETFPVVKLSGLSETKKKAYRILDNKLQNDSTWDFENLGLELDSLVGDGFNLEEWGLDDLRALFPVDDEIDVEEDAGPGEIPEETYINKGDVITLGEHTVLCSDCLEADPLNEKASLWITDPPYGVGYVGKAENKMTIENDDISEAELEKLWEGATNFALSSLTPGGGCYATVPAGPLHSMFLRVWRDADVFHQGLVWAKNSLVMGHGDYHFKHEPILYGWKPGAAHYFVDDRSKTSLLEFDRPTRSAEHPTMKPLPLWGELIKNSSKPGDLVLDTFLGSGTTLIACEQLTRVCYGMEIDPRYCQVILERYEAYCREHSKPFVCTINGEPFNGTPN